MRTPQAVKDAAKFLTDMFPAKYCHLGQYDGYEVYTLDFIGDEPIIGLPWVFLWKEGEEVITISNPVVFDIIDEANRSTRARRKAAREAKEQLNLKDKE